MRTVAKLLKQTPVARRNLTVGDKELIKHEPPSFLRLLHVDAQGAPGGLHANHASGDWSIGIYKGRLVICQAAGVAVQTSVKDTARRS